MSPQERQPDPRHRQPAQGDPSGPPANDGLASLHNQSQEFLSAGNQILNNALSGNSQEFLAANLQHGGQ